MSFSEVWGHLYSIYCIYSLPESFNWLQNIPSQCAISLIIDCKSIPPYVNNVPDSGLLSQWHIFEVYLFSTSTLTCNSESSQDLALTRVHQTFSLIVYKTHIHIYIYIYIYIYTECNRRNVRDFGRVFLMLNYTDITQNTYIQS